MQSLQTIFPALAVVFGLIFTGVFVRRIGWMNASADRTMIQLTVRLLFPCLVIDRLTGADWLHDASDLLVPSTVGFALTAIGFMVAWIVATLFAKPLALDTANKRRTFVLCAGMFNYGYIPIPLVGELFADDPTMMPTLLIHNVGVDIAMWTLGIVIISGGFSRQTWKGIFNPVVISIIVALVLKIIEPIFIAQPIPGMHAVLAPGARVIQLLGECAIPMSLLLTGATIADVWQDADLHKALGTSVGGVVVRLMILPLIFLGLAYVSPVSDALAKVMVIQAAMPAAIFPIVLAKHYGGDAPTAVRVVIVTQIIGVITIPMWLAIGLPLVK